MNSKTPNTIHDKHTHSKGNNMFAHLKSFSLIAWSLLTAVSTSLYAQEYLGLHFGDSPSQAIECLEQKCESIEQFKAKHITLPLANDSQKHIHCSQVRFDSQTTIENVTLFFADDKLVMIESSGNAIDTIQSQVDSKPSTIGDWETYNEMQIVTNPANDTVWHLNEDATHAHLFLWDSTLPDSPPKIDTTIPYTISLGSTYRTQSKALKPLCQATTKQTIDPPSLPTQPKRQTQLNCYGFYYAGAHRKLEAVFADNRLAMLWILTAKAEEDRIRQSLIQSYGDPIFTSDLVEAFKNWEIVLRKDKPEVLVLSQELQPIMKSTFGG